MFHILQRSACHVSITCTVYTEMWPQPLGSKQPKNNHSHVEGNKKQDQRCSIWAYMSSAAEMWEFPFDRSDLKHFQKSSFFFFFPQFFTLSFVHRVYGHLTCNSRRAVLWNATRGVKYKIEIRFFSVHIGQ